MFNFNYLEVKIDLEERKIANWLSSVVTSENKKVGQINYVFCNDAYLLDVNQRFLDHDTYTDIITFDNSIGDFVNADIYISLERVSDNAAKFNISFYEELLRVLVHGVLHICGYKDKTEEEDSLMRSKENEKIEMFHVKQ